MEDFEHKNESTMPPLVTPPASPTTTKAQVKAGSIQLDPPLDAPRKKRAYRKSKPSTNSPKRQLAPDFVPSSYSVICGRGKECFDSEGNKRFRKIINKFLDEYAEAPGKSEKSNIVSKAMNIIREASPEGAFVKCEKGVWFEVSSRYAREKVGAWFRDCLHNKYKSSSKAKHARKMAKRVSLNALDPEELMNFPLEVEFDLPELDNKFYDEYDRRHNSDSSTGSTDSSKRTGNEDTKTIKKNKPVDPPADIFEAPIQVDSFPCHHHDPPADPPVDEFTKVLNDHDAAFYDVDDISLSLVPFDAVDDDEL